MCADKGIPRARQLRYSVGGLMLVMLVSSVMGAAGYYFVQSLRGGRQSRAVFVIFTLAAPVVLVVLVSTLRAIWMRLKR